jgi:hypothetical protein
MMEPLFSIKPLGNDSPGIDGTAPRFKSLCLNFKASINKIAPRFNNHVSNCIKMNYNPGGISSLIVKCNPMNHELRRSSII